MYTPAPSSPTKHPAITNPNNQSQVFRVTVSHTNPEPIYCAQNTGQHCKNGMVAIINPSGSLTLDAYSALARNAGNALVPATGAFGGQAAPNQSASSSGAGSSSSSGAGVSTTTTTQTGSFTTTATATETQTGGGGGGGGASSTQTQSATTTSSTGKPSGTGNAAAGVAVPVAGLVAVAVGAFFV